MSSSYLAPNLDGLKTTTAVAIEANKAVTFSGGLVAIAGAGADAIGFAHEYAGVSSSITIARAGGGAFAIAGGVITAGDRLKVDASGDLIVAAVANDISVARAEVDAAAGDHFAVFVETVRIHV